MKDYKEYYISRPDWNKYHHYLVVINGKPIAEYVIRKNDIILCTGGCSGLDKDWELISEEELFLKCL